ncbi:MAG: phosphoribosyltransferase [Acidobacteriota bacterium]
MLFNDRSDAGKRLATRLMSYANDPDVIILALPRGGVPVAYEIAEALNAPLDVFLVRKLGVPGHRELAMGAIASGGVCVINDDVVNYLNIPDEVIDRVSQEETQELYRREFLYRHGRAMPELPGRTIILVDDGLATGSSMRVAVKALKLAKPSRIVVAVPVAAPTTCNDFKDEVDEIICLETPESLQAIGLWYKDFSQTTDTQVQELLERSAQRTARRTTSKGA